MCIPQAIEQFCNYFRDQIRVIDAISIDPVRAQGTDQESHQIRFYKKALLITQIDTLAGIRYPKERYPEMNRRNHERFINFLDEHGIWPEGNLVSLPFLEESLRKANVTNGRLFEYVSTKYESSFEDGSFNIDFTEIDVEATELIKLSTTAREEKAIRENKHFELLYRYRNYLVHEARVPGNAMEVTDDERPYYHGYLGEHKLFLAYPLRHFLTLVENSINVIEEHLTTNQLNPYDFVSETTRW
jgi:hypothetical protein